MNSIICLTTVVFLALVVSDLKADIAISRKFARSLVSLAVFIPLLTAPEISPELQLVATGGFVAMVWALRLAVDWLHQAVHRFRLEIAYQERELRGEYISLAERRNGQEAKCDALDGLFLNKVNWAAALFGSAMMLFGIIRHFYY